MTLRRKIVALTLCLLLLFALTAAASLLLQNRISEDFSAASFELCARFGCGGEISRAPQGAFRLVNRCVSAQS